MKFIIDFKNDTSEQQIQEYLARHGATVVKEFNHFEKTYVVEALTPPASEPCTEHVLNDDEHDLQLLNTTIISDQNYGKKHLTGEICTIVNDEQNWWKTYVMDHPDLDSPSYQIDRRGQDSVVYVLDSGIETAHPEFTGRKVSLLWSFNGDPTDKRGHGTAIASVIVGNTCGITDATVKSVKIFDPDTPTKQSDLLTGLDEIFKDVMSNGYQGAVVNCSWVISRNSLVESKMRVMIDAGIFIVAAAGNTGQPIDEVTPASMPEVLTVGSYNIHLEPSDFSSYTGTTMISCTNGATNHGTLDGWAPGENIYAAGLNNTLGYVAGTSIAAGIQSAVIAYNLSLWPATMVLNNTLVQYYSSISLQKRDLLNLSDPKYAGSRNRSSSLMDYIDFEGRTTYGWIASGLENQYTFANLFNPHLVASVVLHAPLPSNYTITSWGKFYGLNTAIDQDYVYTKIPVTVNNVDGTVQNYDLEIITVKSYDWPEDFTTGDPVLDVKLTATIYCSNGTDQDCFPNNSDCVDNCGSVGCGMGINKTACPGSNNYVCYCFF